jgi:predicted transglutaminase-like cysteine proteinase
VLPGAGPCAGVVVACALSVCAGCRPAHAAEDDVPLVLENVNLGINHRIVFADDATNWGSQEYWATPQETYARGAGDCEDFAIAKYFALRNAGLPSERLRLAYAELRIGGVDGPTRRHIVVTYLPEGGAPGSERILDNVIDEVRPLARRPDLRILLSFDTEGVWHGLDRGLPARNARDILRWSAVLSRVGDQQQGLLIGVRVSLLPRTSR